MLTKTLRADEYLNIGIVLKTTFVFGEKTDCRLYVKRYLMTILNLLHVM